VEALLRWCDPEGTVHSPATFIPILEQTGLINELGEWIVAQACGQSRAWRDAGLPAVQMAVNLAAPQFRDAELPRVIERALASAGVPPQGLELEVTESMLMSDIPVVTHTLGQFRDMGVRVALDDFGTGYSSLAYLRQFPLDILKIDRSFVNDIHDGNGGVAIIRTILSLAENLCLETVAEGVESSEQHEFLEAEGCGSIQGFLFARPEAPEVCAEMLARQNQAQGEASP
jgi:EAL domain-containing protein (putative c-di-GMP-specific phosphodiesterase class I)